jgi:hypothetical protein
MENENKFAVQTREKSVIETSEMHDWMDENYISCSYLGHGCYLVEGQSDATLLKLFWG